MLVGVKEKTCQQQIVLHHTRVTGHGWELAYGLRVLVDDKSVYCMYVLAGNKGS